MIRCICRLCMHIIDIVNFYWLNAHYLVPICFTGSRLSTDVTNAAKAFVAQVIYHLETFDVTTIRASTPMYLMARRIRPLARRVWPYWFQIQRIVSCCCSTRCIAVTQKDPPQQDSLRTASNHRVRYGGVLK